MIHMINKVHDLPRCEAVCASPYTNDPEKAVMKCRCKARIMFNGKTLCRRHAEVFALQLLIAASDDDLAEDELT